MNPFPALDPIPVPAPIWLLKTLHIVTMSLHFVAVQMLLGGLIVAICLHLLLRHSESRTAAAAIARRLPIVMTYVINFGVPPLLFAQVLYGVALYTSSVLIGAWWIAVIPLLMACYWLLYQFQRSWLHDRPGWWFGLGALVLAGAIAQIYSANMTLMLRPEVWQSMYANSNAGVHLPTGDPTMPWRLLTMFAGALLTAGLWMIWLSSRSTFEASEARFLSSTGGRLVAVMAVVEAAVVTRLAGVQPDTVKRALESDVFAQSSSYVWAAMLVVILAVGLWGGFSRTRMAILPWVAVAAVVVRTGAMTLYRDVIRDQTLLSKGYDVWQRNVATNWSVVVFFLVLFVAGLGTVGWLISVVAKAKRVMEKTA